MSVYRCVFLRTTECAAESRHKQTSVANWNETPLTVWVWVRESKVIVVVNVMSHLNKVYYEGHNIYSDKNIFDVCNSIPMVLICDTKKAEFYQPA